MKIHELKTDPTVFKYSFSMLNNFEIRYNDRDYRAGDLLVLKETSHTRKEMDDGAPLEYSGRKIAVKVDYILRGPIYGLKDGWIIMSVHRVDSICLWRAQFKST